MNNEPVVFVVDDDEAMRQSLRWLIGSVGLRVETFASASEFLETYDPRQPGCLVLDVRMQGMSGLELQERLNEQGEAMPVIIITGFADVPMAVRAMKGGAIEFLQKPFNDQVLLDHVQKAIVRDLQRRRQRAAHQQVIARLETLTRREREVLDHVVEGRSSKQIAEKLGVSFKTVEAHRAKIMKKMHARGIPHLIRMFLTATMKAT